VRVIIQRVSEATVTINETVKSKISRGMLILLGIEEADTHEDVEWLSAKISKLRIFADADGKMNLSINESGGNVIVVSQFTLHASTKKGNRPSFIKAAQPEKAFQLYTAFIKALEKDIGKPVQTGEFGTYMNVKLVNDGPVTIFIDTKNKE
jgi:D-tyrosyl-tRNA(Tyr) deacylase